MSGPSYRLRERHTIQGVDRRQRYFLLMGICLTLIISAWFVVRLFSTTVAIVMSLVAMVIPPVAAIVGNRSDPKPRRPQGGGP